MKYSIEIGKIVEGAIKKDTAKVRSYVEQLIKKLDEEGENISADKFRKMLSLSPVVALSSFGHDANPVPVDNESRMPLVDLTFPGENDGSVFLSKSNMFQVNEFIENYRCSDKLSREGLEIGNTLILYGPPGCGKTKTARMISKELGLPLVTARLDGLISSYLGTTAKNMRRIFEYVQRMPCVLLLDEFDAIAKARDDGNELGELKRVVNSLLQNIDNVGKECLIIAATNHEQLLDNAVWRRFSYKLKIEPPDTEAIGQMIKELIGNRLALSNAELEQISACFYGKSGATIEETVNKAMRSAVFKNEVLSKKHIYNQLLSSVDLSGSIRTGEFQLERINYFISKNTPERKYFTYENIGEILGLTKGYISILLKEGKKDD